MPHGFRSSFRNWAEENHNYSRRAVELCLAHANENKVEKAYLRSNLLSKRIEIMNEWNNFLSNFLVIGCLGNLTATVRNPAVEILSILEFDC